MAQRKIPLKPDVVLNDYWKDNEKFADLLNAVFFDGKEVVHKEQLRDADSENSVVLEQGKKISTVKADRDLLKVVKFCDAFCVKIALVGVEQQQNIHYAMPVRVMVYDANTYYNQWTDLKKKYKNNGGLQGDELLSGMKSTDKFYPVITIVIYYGEAPWNGAKSIHEVLNIPTQLQNFVNDYTMKLIEARDNKYTFHNIDNKALFDLLGILYDSRMSKQERCRKAQEYKTSHEVAIAVAAAANSKLRLEEIGDGDMCTVFDYVREEALAQGQEQGLEQGIQAIVESCQELGASRNRAVAQLMKKFDLEEQSAQEKVNKYWKAEI